MLHVRNTGNVNMYSFWCGSFETKMLLLSELRANRTNREDVNNDKVNRILSVETKSRHYKDDSVLLSPKGGSSDISKEDFGFKIFNNPGTPTPTEIESDEPSTMKITPGSKESNDKQIIKIGDQEKLLPNASQELTLSKPRTSPPTPPPKKHSAKVDDKVSLSPTLSASLEKEYEPSKELLKTAPVSPKSPPSMPPPLPPPKKNSTRPDDKVSLSLTLSAYLEKEMMSSSSNTFATNNEAKVRVEDLPDVMPPKLVQRPPTPKKIYPVIESTSPPRKMPSTPPPRVIIPLIQSHK